jgi:hypothetical protein
MQFSTVAGAPRNRIARAAVDWRPFVSARLRPLQWFQAFVVVFVAALGLAAKTGLVDANEMSYSASLLLTAIVAWNFCSWRLAGRVWFEPYSLFLLSATMFNGGQALLEVFYLNKDGVLGSVFSPELTVAGLYLVALGLAAFHFGALAGLAQTTKPLLPGPSNPGAVDARLKSARMVGFACLAISIVPMGILLRDTLTTSLSRGYGGLYGRSDGLSSGVQVIAAFMIPGAMYLTAGSRKKMMPVVIAGIFVLIYSSVMFLSGSRAPAVMILVSYAWIFERSVRPLPRIALVSLGVVILLTFPLVAALRNTPGLWQDPSRLITEAFAAQKNPLIAPISEMGGSLATVVQSIGLIPSVRPFDYGTSYAYAASTVIPNVGWEIHPAIAHGLLGDWLVKTVNPYIASHGGGLGYSFIAEAFANFGWFGAAPLLACFGYLLMRLFQWGTDTADSVRCALLGTFLSFFLLFARGESASVVRSLAWYSFVPYVAVSLLSPRFVQQTVFKRGSIARRTI